MGTNLINCIQHRNGPNQRPPNSIFGNSISNQKLISNHLVCGFMGAILGGIAFIAYINYTIKHEPSHNRMGALGVLSISFLILSLMVACMLLICFKRRKEAVCNQPGPNLESDDLVFGDPSNIVVDMNENPPSYESVIMPSRLNKASDTLPPAYNTIDLV